MRAGACTVQQTLTSEAASVLKLSLSLARRRGHAQVTPLHVAATLLSSRASLLRRACLKSHPHPSSHPLQCRALELCFNVALNRLPTTPGPLLHSHPSLSNALIAALKRAQAHQRRGCIEQQQQQPLLAIKVELEQLIISILDDPSVSRVMREAGFSSTCVKNNLEDTASSVFQCYSSCSSSPSEFQTSFWPTHFLNSSAEQNPVVFPAQKRHFISSAHFIDSGAEKKEDLRLILEVMLRKKRRNTVVVGDGFSSTEGLVLELMGKVERGEVPDELRSVQFVKFQLCPVSLKFMKREDVEMKIAELRRKVGSHALEGGAVIYAGDLKWAVEEAHVRGGEGGVYYSPVEHVIAEVGRLLSDFSSCSNSKVWLMGVANYQTYMKCQMKTPPLEMQWALQAVAVPSGGLALSLHASSGLDARASFSSSPSQLAESKLFSAHEEQDKLICCPECTSNFEREAGIFKSTQQKPGSGDANDMDRGLNMPYWLQQYRAENHPKKDILLELRRKWNKLCQSLHQPKHNFIQMNPSLINHSGGKSYAYSTPYPLWPTSFQFKQNALTDLNSISFAESTSKPGSNSNHMAQLKNQQPWSVEIGGGNVTQNNHPSELNLDTLKRGDTKEVKITLALGNPLFSDSTTSIDQMKATKDLGDLCRELQENIYWQSETIPEIAAALHDCKSRAKNGTWLLMQGTDWIGNRRLARTIADSLYGSADRLVHMNLKRTSGASCAEILSEALISDPYRVILIEEIDCAETHFIKLLTIGFEDGKLEDLNGREVHFSHSIIILTTCSPMKFDEDNNTEKSNSVIRLKLQLEETELDTANSNSYKRKADWASSNNAKRLRTGENEDHLIIQESEIEKKQFLRQSSATNLDLNICAEEDEGEGEESNANQSDLTQETVTDVHIPNGFLESIQNRFVFNRSPARMGLMSEKFLSKLNRSFEQAIGSERRGFLCLCVDGVVLEELVEASDTFGESLFEKWLKDIFQMSLVTVKNGGKEKVIRLSVAEGKDGNLETAYEGSSLPNGIQVVNYIN
ncbi:protein SMAX1-LIKE 4 [Cinnamomum micranthum f. kanehirae]|uniref:Protein SMAX1-LIKE 4 n=1 Tax=Cinnamomum micranthum f. kanehirae TaxID=337451 RepID=A0A443PL33_9MAGN|nr:protein SMAX1-LIKE 4 [Cinnamomum micranthum f. kanehirae]